MSNENLYQVDLIQKKISILEMIEKLKNCGLVWKQQEPSSWKLFHNDGNAVWELTLTKVSNFKSSGDKSIVYDVILLDFKKNDSFFYSINSDNDPNLIEMWNEIAGDVEFEKEEILLRDLQVAKSLKSLIASVTKHSSSGGLIAGTPNLINIHEVVIDSYGLKIRKTNAPFEQILPNYTLYGPRRLAVFGGKTYVASVSVPYCTMNEQEEYSVDGFGWINVIDGDTKFNNQIYNTNRRISFPFQMACENIAVTNTSAPTGTSNLIGSSRYLRTKIYASGMFGNFIASINTEKQVFEKFIYTQYQTCSMCINQNLNFLYVSQTKMDINNQVWRFDLPFGPPYPPDGSPVALPVNPPTLATGPVFQNPTDVPVGVQNTPGQSYLTLISTLWDAVVYSYDLGTASLNDMSIDYNTNYLYIADASEDQVLVLDPLKNYEIIQKIKTGLLPIGVTIYKSSLYVVNNESKTISVFDIGNGYGKLIATIGVENRPIRMKINPKTNLGYVAIFGESGSYDNRIAVVDLKTKKTIEYYTVGYGPYDVDIDLDDEILFVSCYLSNNVWTINLKNTSAPLS